MRLGVVVEVERRAVGDGDRARAVEIGAAFDPEDRLVHVDAAGIDDAGVDQTQFRAADLGQGEPFMSNVAAPPVLRMSQRKSLRKVAGPVRVMRRKAVGLCASRVDDRPEPLTPLPIDLDQFIAARSRPEAADIQRAAGLDRRLAGLVPQAAVVPQGHDAAGDRACRRRRCSRPPGSACRCRSS